jgi:predicted O-methyltransferase YrrM
LGRFFEKHFHSIHRIIADRLFPDFFAAREARRLVEPAAPLNGQGGRRAIVERIVRDCAIQQFIETGTFRGGTTRWFAQFGIPVYTVEANPRLARFAQIVLADMPLVQIAEMDSVAFLNRLSADPAITAQTTLFYLDAHWERRLPLGDEIVIVTRYFPKAIMIVDDFQVPDDPDYTFDNFGPGKRLDLEYVRHTGVADLEIFFPALPGMEEDPPRRGCVVMTTDVPMAKILRSIDLLRPFPFSMSVP